MERHRWVKAKTKLARGEAQVLMRRGKDLTSWLEFDDGKVICFDHKRYKTEDIATAVLKGWQKDARDEGFAPVKVAPLPRDPSRPRVVWTDEQRKLTLRLRPVPVIAYDRGANFRSSRVAFNEHAALWSPKHAKPAIARRMRQVIKNYKSSSPPALPLDPEVEAVAALMLGVAQNADETRNGVWLVSYWAASGGPALALQALRASWSLTLEGTSHAARDLSRRWSLSKAKAPLWVTQAMKPVCAAFTEGDVMPWAALRLALFAADARSYAAAKQEAARWLVADGGVAAVPVAFAFPQEAAWVAATADRRDFHACLLATLEDPWEQLGAALSLGSWKMADAAKWAPSMVLAAGPDAAWAIAVLLDKATTEPVRKQLAQTLALIESVDAAAALARPRKSKAVAKIAADYFARLPRLAKAVKFRP